MTKVLASARAHGIAPGIHVANAVQARRRIAEGWQFVAISSEAGLMMAHTREITNSLGLAVGGAAVKY